MQCHGHHYRAQFVISGCGSVIPPKGTAVPPPAPVSIKRELGSRGDRAIKCSSRRVLYCPFIRDRWKPDGTSRRSILPTEISAVISLNVVCPRVTAKRISDETATARPRSQTRKTHRWAAVTREATILCRRSRRGSTIAFEYWQDDHKFQKEQLPWWHGGEVNEMRRRTQFG